jgi:hypothetical protein
MAEVKEFDNHSTIQIRKDVYFVFGNLQKGDDPIDKIKNSFKSFNKYFESIGEEKPEVNMNWKTGQKDQWVLSDDYRILQILKRTENKKENSYNKAIIRTCVATFAVNDSTFFDTDFELHPDRYRISNSNINNDVRIASRENPTANEILFSKYVAKGEEPKKAYMRTYSTENEKYAADMSRILMRQERIHENVSEEVERLLKDEGVSKRYIIQQYKQLIDEGLLNIKDCSGSVRAALKDLADMSAMMPEKNKSSASQGALKAITSDKLKEVEQAEFTVENSDQKENFEQEYHNHSNHNQSDSLLSETGRGLLS